MTHIIRLLLKIDLKVEILFLLYNKENDIKNKTFIWALQSG